MLVPTAFCFALWFSINARTAFAVCDHSRPVALCCLGDGPWSSGSDLWGSYCGYYPADPSELIGSRCIPEPSVGCTDKSFPLCCAGTWPGPSYECALGTNCEVPATMPPPERHRGRATSETLPDGWALVRYCAVDEANRVIIDDHAAILSDNTPVTCVNYCIQSGFDYAGVEYGDECHCGTGYTGGARAPTADCNMPCAGDPSLTCGGSWRIQIYSSEPQEYL